MPKVIYGPVKVLELIHSSGITGPGRIVLGLAKYIDRQEFTLDVLCPANGFLADELGKTKAKIIPLTWRKTLDFGNFLEIKKQLQKEDYHIFHIHSGQLNAFAKIMARSLGIPAVVLTEHMAVSDHGWIKNKLALFLHLSLHRLSDLLVDKIITVSDASREAFITRQGISPAKAETIYNGIDLEENQTRAGDKNSIKAELGIPVDAPVLAVIGRLSPEKGQRIFVLSGREIVKDYPKARFLLIGDGPQRHQLEELIAELGLQENFILTGFRKNITATLDIVDIVVQPSLVAGEAFGLTVAEAMAKAKAVIVSDISCFREIISDQVNGLLFPVGDQHSLAQKAHLLLGNFQLRNALGEQGQKTIKEKFDIRINVHKTQDAYKRLLKQKGFVLYFEHIREVEEKFLDTLNRESPLPPEKLKACRSGVNKLLVFIQAQKRSKGQVKRYLSGEYVFLIERFLQFIEANRIFLDPVSSYNCRLFKQEIKASPVSAKDYDERIQLQSEQFQIDNYYQPKDQALKRRVELILGYVAPQGGERILDVGCGVGTFAFHCAKSGAFCEGVDYSQESLEVAKRLISHFGLGKKVDFRCCDISQGLPFPDQVFDKIVAADFIEHIDEIQKIKLLSELHRLLKPQGKAIIFTPNLLREWLGWFKSKLTGMLGGVASETRLHFGLTNRFRFEKMLRSNGFNFKRIFLDMDRPYLAKIPIFKEVLSLNLLWVIEKRT